jgi:hypothetical protein
MNIETYRLLSCSLVQYFKVHVPDRDDFAKIASTRTAGQQYVRMACFDKPK